MNFTFIIIKTSNKRISCRIFFNRKTNRSTYFSITNKTKNMAFNSIFLVSILQNICSIETFAANPYTWLSIWVYFNTISIWRRFVSDIANHIIIDFSMKLNKTLNYSSTLFWFKDSFDWLLRLPEEKNLTS
jgi:hypothetical protein